MSATAKGLWALLFLVAVALAAVFLLGALAHLFVEAARLGWEMVGQWVAV